LISCAREKFSTTSSRRVGIVLGEYSVSSTASIASGEADNVCASRRCEGLAGACGWAGRVGLRIEVGRELLGDSEGLDAIAAAAVVLAVSSLGISS
jgi:hypothetical protein